MVIVIQTLLHKVSDKFCTALEMHGSCSEDHCGIFPNQLRLLLQRVTITVNRRRKNYYDW